MILQLLDGSILEQVLKLGFKASNNQAEYEALLAGLKVAEELQVKELLIHCDLMLIINQVTRDYATHDPTMMLYINKKSNN